MFRLDEGLKVHLHRHPVDFRLSINGLATLVQQALGLDPFAACVYVFSNRRRNRVKVLGWDRAAQGPDGGRLRRIAALAHRPRGLNHTYPDNSLAPGAQFMDRSQLTAPFSNAR